MHLIYRGPRRRQNTIVLTYLFAALTILTLSILTWKLHPIAAKLNLLIAARLGWRAYKMGIKKVHAPTDAFAVLPAYVITAIATLYLQVWVPGRIGLTAILATISFVLLACIFDRVIGEW